MIGKLYLIPSPIGNLEDVSPRIKKILNECDLIACEDTRNTSKLLSLLGISKPTFSCHEHNEKEATSKLIEMIKNGKIIGYLSDAGYPGISDPGEILSKECIKNNIVVTPLSGPSAFINALVASTSDTTHFMFYGFLDSKSSQRIKELKDIKDFKNTIIFYEAPHRINETLKDLYTVFGNRNITIAREISKIYEEFIYSTLKDLVESPRDYKGELVLVVDGNKNNDSIDEKEIIELFNQLEKAGLNKKDAINALSILKNINKNYLKKLFF